jgi:hypothetical protein
MLKTIDAILFLTSSVITFNLVATTPIMASRARINIWLVIIEKYINLNYFFNKQSKQS